MFDNTMHVGMHCPNCVAAALKGSICLKDEGRQWLAQAIRHLRNGLGSRVNLGTPLIYLHPPPRPLSAGVHCIVFRGELAAMCVAVPTHPTATIRLAPPGRAAAAAARRGPSRAWDRQQVCHGAPPVDRRQRPEEPRPRPRTDRTTSRRGRKGRQLFGLPHRAKVFAGLSRLRDSRSNIDDIKFSNARGRPPPRATVAQPRSWTGEVRPKRASGRRKNLYIQSPS